MYEHAPLAITQVAIFAGILFNKHDRSNLKVDIIGRMEQNEKHTEKHLDEINTRLLVIEADRRQFYSIPGELKARVELLEKRR